MTNDANPTEKNLPVLAKRKIPVMPLAVIAGGGVLVFWVFHLSVFGVVFFLGLLLTVFGLRKKIRSIDSAQSQTSEQLTQSEIVSTYVGDQIKRDISKARYLENLSKMGEELGDVYEGLLSEIKNFLKVVDSRFQKTELSYGRYKGAGEEAFLTAIQCLHQSSLLLQTLDQSSDQAVQKQADSSQNQELLQLRVKQKGKVTEGVQQAKAAWFELQKVTAALNELAPTAQLTSSDLQSNLEQLKILADRAKLFQNINKE